MPTDKEITEDISYSVAPYEGDWTPSEAGHLLRRTLYGHTRAQLNYATSLTLEDIVYEILNLTPTNPPLTHSTNEGVAPLGQTWVNSALPSNNPNQTEDARRESFFAWTNERINRRAFSIQEKMCLFWHDHFGVEFTFDSRATYNYHETIRTNALGNFKDIVKAMTIDPSMLVFLSGAVNNRFSPNENYARELFELYTVGKGPQIGEGDYSYFTEQDIFEAAKVLTGWTIQGFGSDSEPTTYSEFTNILHDNTVKQLSSYYNNATINPQGDEEYAVLIDIIFQHPQVAKHICRKLYRWFVNHDLTSEVEETVIEELANTLRNNDYEVLPVLDQLFKSEHFYDTSIRGSMLRNPIEFIYGIMNGVDSSPDPTFTIQDTYALYQFAYFGSAALGLDYGTPHSVGGWPAYYQEPAFTQLWANSSLIKLRFDIVDLLTVTEGIQANGKAWGIDHHQFLSSLSLPQSAPDIIDDLAELFCPKGLSTAKKDMLKDTLLSGLPEFVWTQTYNNYLADPTNTDYSEPIRIRFALTLRELFKLPEFQTM
jgi:uncharacterized protein (DUF1800 family)